MTGFSIVHELDRSISVRLDGVELAEYVYAPDTVPLESPKPYLHPLRTRAGHLVSLFRPHDHVWHKGIAWSLPHVGTENFWGGPTFVPGPVLRAAREQRTRRARGADSNCGRMPSPP